MPEGPSIVLLKENILKLTGKKVTAAKGSILPDENLLIGKTLKDIKTFGKQTFLVFDSFSFKIHLMMFGSYSLSEKKHIQKSLRLALFFNDEELYFYTCSVTIIDNKELKLIDWEADIMSDQWNPSKAKTKMLDRPQMLICDALMNQEIFAGVGNIIKNEALFRTKVHPESKIENLSSKLLDTIIIETRHYSFDFLKWRRNNELKRHYQIYQKKTCPICGLKVIRKGTGKSRRTSFICLNHQTLYS